MANSRVIKDKDKNPIPITKKKKKTLTLESGKKVTLNDFVYFDSDRPDRVYQIGRVIALTRQYGVALPTLEVEVYYRQADINATFSLGTHPRQVYGSFERQKIQLSSVVGKCTVLHRSQIHQFEEYIAFDDCFYYEQVFYQSLSRFYTAIPTSQATHLPSRTLKSLKNQFEYLLCEPEVAYALPSVSRENSPISIGGGEPTTPQAEATQPSASEADPDVDIEACEEDEDSDDEDGPGEPICTKTKPICSFFFPYRYFSLVRESSLKEPTDSEGLLPPSEIAVGEDFQIELPPYNGPSSTAGNQSDDEASPEQRDKAISILEALSGMEFAIPTYFSEFQSRALQEMVNNDFDLEKVAEALRQADFGIALWSKEELATLEEQLLAEGLKLHKIAEKFPNRSRVEVVRQFYRWKGDMQRLYANEKDAFDKIDPGLLAIVLDNTAQGLSVSLEPQEQPKRKSRRAASNSSDQCANCFTRHVGSWHPIPSGSLGEDALYCETCANHWYRYGTHFSPENLEKRKRSMSISSTQAIQPSRKQTRKGRPKASTEEPSSPHIKREQSLDAKPPEKQQKFAVPINTISPRLLSKHHSAEALTKASNHEKVISDASKVVVSPQVCPASPLGGKIKEEVSSMNITVASPQLESEQTLAVTNGTDLSYFSCQVCFGNARNHHKVVCSTCSLVVHYDCFSLEAYSNDWTCDWCLNLSNKQNSVNPTCVICHIPSAQASTCLKPTSKFNWVHVSCALLMLPLYLSKGEVTGVSDLDLSSWKERCKICHEHKGFKVACRFCPTQLVHPACAISNNSFHVGFDNSLVPSVICPAHSNIPPPKALDSIDSNTRKSLMSIHLQTRALPAPSAEPETSMPVSNGGTFHSLIPRLQLICSTCGVDSSPLWWWPGPRGNLSGTLCPYLPSFDSRASSGEADLAPITTLQCHICRWNHMRPLPQNTPPMQPANAM